MNKKCAIVIVLTLLYYHKPSGSLASAGLHCYGMTTKKAV